MKKIPVLALLLTIALMTNAQSYLSGGIDLSKGNKRFPKKAKFGLGLSIEGYYSLYRTGGLRAYLAYDFFSQRSFANPDTLRALGYHGKDLSFIPVKVGYQQYIVPNVAFIYSDIGISFLQSSSQYKFKTVRLAYGLGAGYLFELASGKFLEFNLSYNVNDANQYNVADNYGTLRIAYGFRCKQ